MGKIGKVKKREPSLHSRSARRNASPPLKIKNVPATSSIAAETTPQWLYSAQDSGISKRKKTKPPTRQQRLRHERGLEKAGATEDKLRHKIEESKMRSRKVQGRRRGWEEVNGGVEVPVRKAEAGKVSGGGERDEGEEGVDEDMDGTVEDDGGVKGIAIVQGNGDVLESKEDVDGGGSADLELKRNDGDGASEEVDEIS